VAAFDAIHVRGAVSGPHAGRWTVAEGGRTFIFQPEAAFAPGERVFVTVPIGDTEEPGFSFDFTTSSTARELELPEEPGVGSPESPDAGAETPGARAAPAAAPRHALVLPQGFPRVTVAVNDNPAPGYIFVAPHLAPAAPPEFAIMYDDAGAPAFFRLMPRRPVDFKKHPTVGLYSYLTTQQSVQVVNEAFELLDTFGPENGYTTIDTHDFRILPNGNVWIGIIDLQHVDMSQIVPGGNPNALVHGFVMQEQDPSHNVVFQWRSWDHFAITEATGVDFTASFIDCVHANAFDLDPDGNILLSCRELCEITKIDRQTGDILWRFGGTQNQFTLVGDTRWFERQHCVRRTSAGTITIFDNSALTSPFQSRVVEYQLDEVNKVATLVWSFTHSPPLYSPYGANAQRLPNGNTLINWGPVGRITEVRTDGTKAFDLIFDTHTAYRAFRFEWNGVAARPELWAFALPFQVTLRFVKFGDPDVAQFNVYRSPYPGATTHVGSTTGSSFVLDVVPHELLYVRVTAEDSTGVESPYSNELLIVAPYADDAPVLTTATSRTVLEQNHPNPFAPSTTIAFTLAERGAVDLSVYDVCGRLVRTLERGSMSAGTGEVVWDGTDRNGRRVGAGVYFCRLRAEGRTLTKRMTRIE
jgi:hypothetical protein